MVSVWGDVGGVFWREEGGLRGLALFLRSLPARRPVAHAACVRDQRLQLRSGEHRARRDAGASPGSQ